MKQFLNKPFVIGLAAIFIGVPWLVMDLMGLGTKYTSDPATWGTYLEPSWRFAIITPGVIVITGIVFLVGDFLKKK